MNEEWRKIQGTNYEVSSFGKVRNKKGKGLKVQNEHYCVVRIGGKKYYIHVLVLNTFKGPRPYPRSQARHLDGNRKNNALENLEWGSRRQNELDKARHGTSKRKLSVQRVISIRRDYSSGVPITKIAKSNGVSTTTIYQIVSRRTYPEI